MRVRGTQRGVRGWTRLRLPSLALSLLGVLSVSVSTVGPARADSIWQRALHGNREEEREVQAAIERVLLGLGDERDLLRVRVALITLSRGEIHDPRAIVLLVRLRREMGLMPASASEALLKEALLGDLSLTERGWAHFERAHLSLRTRDLKVARSYLDTALSFAWRSPHRAEVFVLRGFVHLRQGQDELALADFSEVARLYAPRRVSVEAHIGSAMAYVLRGDVDRAEAAARTAFLIEAGRASVSRLDPFWDLGLSPAEQRSARTLLLFGKAADLAPKNREAARLARQNACLLLRPSSTAADESALLGTESQEGRGEVPWGSQTLAALRSLWEDTCQLPLGEEQLPETEGRVPEPASEPTGKGT